jgi:predicted DNA-binding protein (MmcQ/YjbR family)
VPRSGNPRPLKRLRDICLALPEAVEKETWGEATFRVRDKIFAMAGVGDGSVPMSCKAPPGVQEMLVGSDPERFYRPAYVGHRGWVGVRLDAGTDWDQVADLVEESYRMTAPKKLSAQLDSPHSQ